MKKQTFFLMALCLSVLGMQAQEKQIFTIDGYVDENITDSCYNIYIGDEYFRIEEDSEPNFALRGLVSSSCQARR